MPAAAQLDLDFDRPTRPVEGDARVDELIRLLADRGWTTGREIRIAQGWDERTIRALAAASDGQILSGQQGYKLTRQATPEEMQHATSWLESQAKEMSQRAGAIRRRWHAAR